MNEQEKTTASQGGDENQLNKKIIKPEIKEEKDAMKEAEIKIESSDKPLSFLTQLGNIFSKHERIISVIIFSSLGIITLLFLSIYVTGKHIADISSFEQIGSAIDGIKTILTTINLLAILTVATLVISVLEFTFLSQKRKQIDVLVSLVALGMTVTIIIFILPVVWKASSIIRDLQNGNVFSILSLGSSDIDLESLEWIKFFGPMSLIFVMCAAILKGCSIFLGKTFTFGKEINGIRSNENNQLLKLQFINFIKKWKMFLIGALTIMVIGIGVFSYFSFFVKTEIDVLTGIELNVSGISGNGEATINTEGLAKTDDAEINAFLSTVTYDVSPKTNLSNGAIVTITAVPDASQMKSLKLQVNNLQKEVVVSGLKKIPEAYNQVLNKDKILAKMDKTVKAEFTNENNYTYTIETIDTYYGIANINTNQAIFNYNNLMNGTIYRIYKVTSEYKSTFSATLNMTTENYYVYGMTNILLNEDDSVDEESSKETNSFGRYSNSFSNKEKAELYIEDKLANPKKVN